VATGTSKPPAFAKAGSDGTVLWEEVPDYRPTSVGSAVLPAP